MECFGGFIGIDIGEKFIKAVHIVKGLRGLVAKDFLRLDNPIGKAFYGDNVEKTLMTVCFRRIRELLGKKVVIGIPNSLMAFRHVRFPNLTAKELKEAVHWECQSFSSVFSGEYFCDYNVVERNGDYINVFLAGAEKRYVEGLYEISIKADMMPLALDALPLAQQRVLNMQKVSGIISILDVGLYNSHLTIVDGGKLAFTQRLNIGDMSLGKGDRLEIWAMEIQQIFHHYSLQTKGKKVGALLIMGEIEQIPLLLEGLKMRLSPTLECIKDLGLNSFIGDSSDSSDYINAIGLALRGQNA